MRRDKTALRVPAGLSLFFFSSSSASNRQVLHLVIWYLSKKVKIYARKIVGSQITCKLMHVSRIKKKWKTSFPRTEKCRFTNHGKNKSLFTLQAKQKCPFTRHGKSIVDPLFNFKFCGHDRSCDLVCIPQPHQYNNV